MDGAEELQLNMWKTAVYSMYKYLRNVANDGSVFLSEDVNGYRSLQSGELVSLFIVLSHLPLSPPPSNFKFFLFSSCK